MLARLADEQVYNLIRSAASTHPASRSVEQKVGDYYASVMDEAAIEAKGLSPLADELAAIAAIADKKSLSAYLGHTLTREVDGLTTNADHILGIWINQGFEDADHNLPHIWQGGLGLPSRDNYLDSSSKASDLRTKYEAHIVAIFKITGLEESEVRAQHVVSLETRIARAFAPDSDAADVSKQNNPWKRTDFSLQAPGIEWESYFNTAGLADQQDFIIWQPSAVTGVSALVQSESLDEWKDYLRFHLVEHYAAALPKAVAQEHFAFETALLNKQSVPSHEDIAVEATNGTLGQAVGQLYAERYFPASSKANAEAMVRDLIAAFRVRISKAGWMAPQTREKALAKLAALEVGVGYPDHWIDYSDLEIVRGDAVGNMRRAEAFFHRRDLAKLKQGVDPIEWPINPQAPGGVIMFSPNAEFFAAAILQPPFFDAHGDSASNYGSAGAGMAHEIFHSFDELGNIYDARGRLRGWWTAEDHAQFESATAKLAAQFDRYCPAANLCVKGRQVAGESIADLAGLVVAHDAYSLSLKGKPDVLINGLTGDQRLFLAFSRRWRKIQPEAALQKQIAADTHAPGEYRSDTVRNVDTWYDAFKVGTADKLFLKPAERVRIW
jgi:predicted metalloendopeptidase